MNIHTKGIVLHKTKYSDTSVIARIYTRVAGVQSFMVKGALSKKGRCVNALLENLSMVEIDFEDRNRDIQYLREITLYHPYSMIPFDMVRRSLLIFYNELIYKLLREYQTDEKIYDFIEKSILELDDEQTLLTDVHLHFMLRLSREMGFFPRDNFSEQNPFFSIEESCFVHDFFMSPHFLNADASHYLHQLMGGGRTEEMPPKQVRNDVLYGLLRYFESHNEQIRHIESVAILSQLWD